jgi:hypothetical protein
LTPKEIDVESLSGLITIASQNLMAYSQNRIKKIHSAIHYYVATEQRVMSVEQTIKEWEQLTKSGLKTFLYKTSHQQILREKKLYEDILTHI